jgi:hypothetical protein
MLDATGHGGHLRFQTKNIRDSVSLIANLGRALADGIDEVYTGHPFIVGELDFSSKVVKMTDQAAKNLAVSRSHVRTHGIDGMLSEVWVEAGIGL